MTSTLVGGIVGAAVALGVYAAAVRVVQRRAPIEIDARAAPRGLLVGAAFLPRRAARAGQIRLFAPGRRQAADRSR